MTLPFLPNEADATFNDQAEPDAVDFEILLLGFRQTGVVSGCDVTQSSGSEMEIDVASGEALLAGVSVTVSAQPDETIATADGSNPRVDLVTVNSGGTVVVTAGTAAGNPVSPAIPANSVPLAFVYVPASDTTITDNQINDKRVFIIASAAADQMFAYNSGEEQGLSGGADATKGAGIVTNVDIKIHGLVFIGTVISGAKYKGYVMTESGGTIASIIDTTPEETATSIDAETTHGQLMLNFTDPVTLTADTTYYLMVGRTDGGDTYTLPIQHGSLRHTFPFGGLVANASMRVAKQAPAVSDSVTFFTSGPPRMGALWEIA